MNWAQRQTEVENALKLVFEKAKNDNSVQDALIKSPLKTIEELTGQTLRQLKIKEVLDSALWGDNSLEDQELEESQLDLVAGGGIFTWEEFVFMMNLCSGNIA